MSPRLLSGRTRRSEQDHWYSLMPVTVMSQAS